MQSKFLYYLEPYILKNIQSFNPTQVARITSAFFMLKQGSIEFIQQMMSVSALVSHSIENKALLELIRQTKTVKEFNREVRILLEYGVIPSVDSLHPRDIYEISIALFAHQIGKQIYYDLLATEFARKQHK